MIPINVSTTFQGRVAIRDKYIKEAERTNQGIMISIGNEYMIMPCGRSSHLEGGYAVGKGKKLYIVGDFPRGEFDVMYGLANGLHKWDAFWHFVDTESL